MKKRGLKYDGDKPALDLIDPWFELEIAKVMTKGAKKYAPNNWKNGMSHDKIIAGIRRHINAIQRGEFIDPEWGYQHAAHAGCGLMFLHWHIRNGLNSFPDDRWGGVGRNSRNVARGRTRRKKASVRRGRNRP